MDDERLQAKLRKLMALAERGVGGEKDNARRMLEKMLARHGMTMADLSEEKRQMFWFKHDTDVERSLGQQISAKVLNTSDYDVYCVYKNKRKRKQFGVMLTPSEAVEFELHYDALRKSLADHMRIAYSAFVQANNIFPVCGVENDDCEITARDMEVIKMAAAITPTQVNPRIGRSADK